MTRLTVTVEVGGERLSNHNSTIRTLNHFTHNPFQNDYDSKDRDTTAVQSDDYRLTTMNTSSSTSSSEGHASASVPLAVRTGPAVCSAEDRPVTVAIWAGAWPSNHQRPTAACSPEDLLVTVVLEVLLVALVLQHVFGVVLPEPLRLVDVEGAGLRLHLLPLASARHRSRQPCSQEEVRGQRGQGGSEGSGGMKSNGV